MTVGHLREYLSKLPDDLRVVVFACDQQGLAEPAIHLVVLREHAPDRWEDVTWDAGHGARQPGDQEALLVRYREEPA